MQGNHFRSWDKGDASGVAVPVGKQRWALALRQEGALRLQAAHIV